jgi:hypothetical protein
MLNLNKLITEGRRLAATELLYWSAKIDRVPLQHLVKSLIIDRDGELRERAKMN